MAYHMIVAQEDQLGVLSKHDIPGFWMQVKEPRRLSGVVVASTQTKKALKVLGLWSKGEKYELYDTDIEGTKLVQLTQSSEAVEGKDAETYVKLCSLSLNKDLRDAEAAIRSTEEEIEGMIRQIAESQRQLFMARAKVLHFQAYTKNREEYWKNEYQKLMEHPDVESVKISKGCIKVKTHRIISVGGKYRALLGPFFIFMSLGGEVRCRPSSHAPIRNGCCHPHIRKGGNICWGNMSGQMGKLIGEYEFGVAITLMIEFLHQGRDDDAYTSLRHWEEHSGE